MNKKNLKEILNAFGRVPSFSALVGNRAFPNRSPISLSWAEVGGVMNENKMLELKIAVLSGNTSFGKPILDGFTSEEFAENLKQIFTADEIKQLFGGEKDFKIAWQSGVGVSDEKTQKAMIKQWSHQIGENNMVLTMKKLEVLTPQAHSGMSLGLRELGDDFGDIHRAATSLFTQAELSSIRKDTSISNAQVGGQLRLGNTEHLNMSVVEKMRTEYGKQIADYCKTELKQSFVSGVKAVVKDAKALVGELVKKKNAPVQEMEKKSESKTQKKDTKQAEMDKVIPPPQKKSLEGTLQGIKKQDKKVQSTQFTRAPSNSH